MKQSPILKRGIIQILKGLFRPVNSKRLLSALCLLSSASSNTGANYLRLPHQRWVSLLRKTWTPQWRRWQSRRTCWWRSWCSRQWQNLCMGRDKAQGSHCHAYITSLSTRHTLSRGVLGGRGRGEELLDSHFASGGMARRAECIYINPLS